MTNTVPTERASFVSIIQHTNAMSDPTRRSFLLGLSALATHPIVPSQPIHRMANSATNPFVICEAEARFGQLYHVLGMELGLKISGQDTNQQLTMFYGKYHKNDGPPLHIHHGQDEQFYLIEGEFLLQVGNQRYTGLATV